MLIRVPLLYLLVQLLVQGALLLLPVVLALLVDCLVVVVGIGRVLFSRACLLQRVVGMGSFFLELMVELLAGSSCDVCGIERGHASISF
jgi:hypothetical protein